MMGEGLRYSAGDDLTYIPPYELHRTGQEVEARGQASSIIGKS